MREGESPQKNIGLASHKASPVNAAAGFVRLADFIRVANSVNKRPHSIRAIALKRYQEQRDKFPK